MKELIHRRPPDRSRQGMSVAFWLTVGQQEEIWKRFLSSSSLAAVPDHLEIVREWHKLGLGILILEEG